MACPFGCSSSTNGGQAAAFDGVLKQYYKGSPNSGTLDVGTGCSEQRAMEAGGLVAYVEADKLCQKVQGIRIIIGDTAEGLHSGFEQINMMHYTNGTQVSVSSNLNINAPVIG